MTDTAVKELREYANLYSVDANVRHLNAIADKFAAALSSTQARADKLEAELVEAKRERDEAREAIAKREVPDDDALSHGAIHEIRALLKANDVPVAAFVDDHVANAIAQRNEARVERDKARAELAEARNKALEEAAIVAEHISAPGLHNPDRFSKGWNGAILRSAAAIRALKTAAGKE